jgi:site-specific recombinase XerC
MAELAYGGGLRLMELLRLRVQDLDLDRGRVMIRSGKGDKDRVTVLPDPAEGAARHASRPLAGTACERPGGGAAGRLAARRTGAQVRPRRRDLGMAVVVSLARDQRGSLRPASAGATM